jgi:uncharacterized membrane protein YfcA
MTTLVLLTAVTFLGSALSATLGAGGGVLLLAALLLFLPPAVAIPVQGVVQLFANVWRGVLYVREVRWRVVLVLVVGAVPGIVLGTLVQRHVPAVAIEILLGVFIVVATVWPLGPRPAAGARDVTLSMGFASGLLSMIVGTVGPLLSAFFLRLRLEPVAQIATAAWCQTALHVMKVSGFMTLGFSLREHGPLLVALVPATIAGTLAGRAVLLRLPVRAFHIALRVLLVVLGLRILWQGVAKLVHPG